MRENRTCGSEGGEALRLPYPYKQQKKTRINFGGVRSGSAGRVQARTLLLLATLDQRTNVALSLWAVAQAALNVFAGVAQLVARCTVRATSVLRGFWLCAWDRAMITARAATGSAKNFGDRYIGRSLGLGSSPA